MISNQISEPFLQLFFSSFLIFFGSALLIEICLFIFQIKSPRIRATCRILPLIKLPIALTLYTISDWVLFQKLNFFSCESLIQKWLIEILPSSIQLEMATNKISTFSKLIVYKFSPFSIDAFIVCLFLISLIIFARLILHYLTASRSLSAVKQKAKVYQGKITNDSLQKEIKRLNATILISEDIYIPCVSGKSIIFPLQISQAFTQEELEAVVAHELEHLKWYDPLVKFSCQLISCVFWWIPTQWWLKKLENAQEHACDTSVYKYHFDQHVLATAIYKVLKYIKQKKIEPLALCLFTSPACLALHRLNLLLTGEHQIIRSLRFSTWGLGITMGVFLFVGLWIC